MRFLWFTHFCSRPFSSLRLVATLKHDNRPHEKGRHDGLLRLRRNGVGSAPQRQCPRAVKAPPLRRNADGGMGEGCSAIPLLV